MGLGGCEVLGGREDDDMNKPHKIHSPIRRLPGQRLREASDEHFEQEIMVPVVLAFLGIVVLLLECLHVFGLVKPSIWFGVMVAILATAFAARKIAKGLPARRLMKRGEEGERIVAQYIERDLLPKGYAVFHDIQLTKDEKAFNIDHLLVGPNGVFAVETKNYSKPSRGEARVSYDGRQVLWNGEKRYDESRQAQAVAAAAHEYIADLTGIRVNVRPVLCAVGWFAASTDLYQHPVLLVMEKTLGSVVPKISPPPGWDEERRRLVVEKLSRV